MKRCGTCAFWSIADISAGGYHRLCCWEDPPTPFWACVTEIHEGGEWTTESDGLRCQTWKPRPGESE